MNRAKRDVNKGFTLVELLATVGIISVVLGMAVYFVLNTINKSKEEAMIIALNNVKETANNYSKEYPDNIIWKSKEDESGIYDACVPIEVLVNKGNLRKKDIKNLDIKYVLLEKNEQNTIISEKEDTGTICEKRMSETVVPLPTYNNVCDDNVYYEEGKHQILVAPKTEIGSNVSFEGRGTSLDNSAEAAGDYEITVKLNNGYLWKDYSRDDKTVTCKVKKANPDLKIFISKDENGNVVEYTGIKGLSIGKHILTLRSNVSGTISLSSSNKDYAKASSDSEIKVLSGAAISVTLEILSTRKYDTTITATFEPEDKKNYNSAKAEFIIGDPKKKEVKSPTAEMCNSIVYDGSSHELISEKNSGYIFINNYGTDAGIYDVIARLNYGYVWKDGEKKGTTKDVTVQCSIGDNYKIVYHANDGTDRSEEQTVLVNHDFSIRSDVFTRKDYIFIGWTIKSDGTKDDNPDNDWTGRTGIWYPSYKNGYAGIENNELHLYAIWKYKYVKLTYNDSRGSACNGTSKQVINGEVYGDLCIPPHKDGYMFLGWFDKKYENNPLNYYSDMHSDLHDYCLEHNGNPFDVPCLYGHYRRNGEGENRKISQYTSTDKVNKTSDFNLYAGWTTNIWAITFERERGTGGPTQLYYKQNDISTFNGKKCYYFTNFELHECVKDGYYITPPTRKGYKFLGYYTEKNGSGTKYVNETGEFVNNLYKQAGNKTLYAKWEQLKCSVENPSGCQTMYVCKREGPQAAIGSGTTFIHHTTIYGTTGCTNAEWCNTLKSGSPIKILGENNGFYHVYVENDSSFVSRGSDESLWANGTKYGYIWKNCLNKDRNVNCFDTRVYGCEG